VSIDVEDLRALLSRPIAFHRLLAIAGGSIGAGVFLSQLIYWSERTTDPEGWIYKTFTDWWDEAALSRHELDTIRVALKKKGLIHEKRAGVPAKLFYRIDWENLRKGLPEAARKHREGVRKRDAKYPDKVPAIQIAGSPQSPLLEQRVPTESTTKTARAHAQEPPPAPEKDVVVVSFVGNGEEKKTTAPAAPKPAELHQEERTQLDAVVREFGLSVEQAQEVRSDVKRKGLGYVQEKAEIARRRPNPPGAFIAALRRNWKAPQSLRPQPKANRKAPAAPEGWFQAQAELYPGALHYTVWANVPASLKAEILARLGTPHERPRRRLIFSLQSTQLQCYEAS
jgi:hypothetical protein